MYVCVCVCVYIGRERRGGQVGGIGVHHINIYTYKHNMIIIYNNKGIDDPHMGEKCGSA